MDIYTKADVVAVVHASVALLSYSLACTVQYPSQKNVALIPMKTIVSIFVFTDLVHTGWLWVANTSNNRLHVIGLQI